MSVFTLINGRPDDRISIFDRGLSYGDGLFETIKRANGALCFWPLHRQRLLAGLERLGIVVDAAVLEQDIQQLIRSAPTALQQDAALKIIITRGAGGRGYRPDPALKANRILTLSPLPDLAAFEHGVRLRVCDTPLSDNPVLAGMKHLSKLDNVMARGEWGEQAGTEGLLLDSRGRVIEGTMSNLFLVKGDTLQTPALDRCGVAGVMRELVVSQLAPVLGLKVVTGHFTLADCYRADEIFITNALIGIVPVLAIGCHPKQAGNVVDRLRQRLRLINNE